MENWQNRTDSIILGNEDETSQFMMDLCENFPMVFQIVQMVPLLKKSSDVLVEKLGEFAESGKSVEMFRYVVSYIELICTAVILVLPRRVYGAFTMETLIATAFGRHVNIQRGEADQITQGANSIFRAAEDGSPNAPDVLMALLCKHWALDVCTHNFSMQNYNYYGTNTVASGSDRSGIHL